jgi:hypothetical protein
LTLALAEVAAARVDFGGESPLLLLLLLLLLLVIADFG